MKGKERIASPAPARAWTRPEDYLGAFARKHPFRKSRLNTPRTQPELPQLLLSTVPFLALIAFLAVLAVAIIILAYPGAQPQPPQKRSVQHEQGVAERGWFQEARKDMHR